MKIFTLGYQNLRLPEYVDLLAGSGVGVVLDVRETAWSNRPEYTKYSMQTALPDAGIEYVHVKSCGNPSENRKTAATPEECLQRYRQYLERNPACVNELLLLVHEADRRGKRVCLTCYERDAAGCHRSILVEALRKRDGRIECEHLEKRPAAPSVQAAPSKRVKTACLPLFADTIVLQS